ncbi:MAG: Ada metal-binding domain-containing protein [Bacilli bacterium]|nr:Ada metal-binding domain-containing protein [Bacilli bacterium]MDD4733745.1 Ada metal-binding domain-containing protein [Bacilli bacterium]
MDNNQYISKIPGTFGGNEKLKIYGKFDCSSALYWISKGQYVNNRVFFPDEESAIAAGYRPCARCMKKEYKLWKQNQI